jgi:hypothetical protein
VPATGSGPTQLPQQPSSEPTSFALFPPVATFPSLS